MPNQRKTEAIWIEKSQRWQIKVQINGQRRAFYSFTPGRKGKVEAEHKADDWLNNGMNKDPKLETLWNEFLESIDKSVSSANYVKHESIGRLWLLPTLKNRRISSITIMDWQRCIDKGVKHGLSNKSCQNIRASITTLYNFARRRRAAMERPDGLTISKKAPKKKRVILQPDQLKTLFSVDTYTYFGKPKLCWYIHIWRFMVLTGIRRGEACGLRKSDLNGDVLYINQAINTHREITGGKNDNAQRHLVITGRVKRVLEDQADMLKKAGIISRYIFSDEKGGQVDPNRVYKIWRLYRAEHEITSSLHELRHTMISIVKADIPISLLKPNVGHSKAMDTTGIYGHEVDGEDMRYATMVDEIFGRFLE